MGPRPLLPLIALGVLLAASHAPAQTENSARKLVDLELVLAVDVSSSVDLQEFHLQMKGLAQAFRDPAVLDAIELAGPNGIAVSLIQWSDWYNQELSIDWMHINDAAGAAVFATEIDGVARYGNGGSTAIAGALQFATRQLEINDYDAARLAIDVSGDGSANQGAQPGDFRDIAVAKGITINGLTILNDNFRLDDYYINNVIGGHAAFVVRADDYFDFAKAILHKLVREIAGPPVAIGPLNGPTQTASGVLAAPTPNRENSLKSGN
ncbi:MAG: DUF1194 domain-containing protein [Alphaproteobacteria bacterium]|nr:DUF1194 domain-containing protein [Alphaproteobacteria bacterium]